MRDLSRLANLFISLPGVGVPAALDSTIVFALPFGIDAAVIVLAARDGAFRYARIERRQLFGTLGVCRLLRFGVEAALGVMYSKRALAWRGSSRRRCSRSFSRFSRRRSSSGWCRRFDG